MKNHSLKLLAFASILGATAAGANGMSDADLRQVYNGSVRYTDAVEFPQLITAGDPTAGRAEFGLGADDDTLDDTAAIFEGTSVIAGTVVSNGTTCASCHRGESNNFLLPPTPISQHVPADDPLITGRNAEAQGDPRMADLFENHGLIKQRASRFNPLRPETDPYRKLFTWRKTQTIINMAFNYGLLTDGRARAAIEQIRGAVFTHTQDGDARFDDLANPHLNDIAVYMQTEFSQPELGALLNPNDPNYDNLVNDPFYTVNATTKAQQKGQKVFQKQCMSCHNMPNVFGNRDHVNGNAVNFPPMYGHTFDVGVAQQNKLHLDFRYYDSAAQTYSALTVPLIREDGKVISITVVDDLGAAAATGRYEDLHRFKVPQLRRIKDLGPYFHDNSAATLEDVVDYFNSDAYNHSVDGKQYPIHLNHDDRANLLAFLEIL